jgi:hypothetical protein
MDNATRIAQFRAHFDATLPQARADALGKRFEVRLDKKTTVVGIIEDVRFGRMVREGHNVRILYAVDLRCGSAQVLRTVTVKRIPC